MNADRHTAPSPVMCGALFEQHPTKAHMTAVCVRPAGHDGDHSNVLPKAGAR